MIVTLKLIISCKTFETLSKTLYMFLWTPPYNNFSQLFQNLTLTCLHFSSHAQITIWWWVNAVIAGALFQCLASPYVVCGYHLTLALCCTMTNHFCVTLAFQQATLVMWTMSPMQKKSYFRLWKQMKHLKLCFDNNDCLLILTRTNLRRYCIVLSFLNIFSNLA